MSSQIANHTHTAPSYALSINEVPSHTHGNSAMEKMYLSIKTIIIRYRGYNNRELVFDLVKDRNKEHGIKTRSEAIEETADLLTRLKFQNSNELFQAGMRKRLIEVITEVLEGDDNVPKKI